MTRMSHSAVTPLVHRVGDLARENETLRKDLAWNQGELAVADAQIAKLRAELAATMLPYKGHTALLINGVLTIVQHSGVVYEMVEQGQRFTDDETNYGRREFRKLPSVPGSPAARIDAALPIEEMGCVGERLERVS